MSKSTESSNGTMSGRVLPTFNGTGDIEAWIRTVTRTAKLRGWSDSDTKDNTVLNASCYLDGEAKIWADNVKFDVVTKWGDAEKLLLGRWKPQLSSMTVISALLSMKKTSKETFHAFADRLRGTARLTSGISDEWLVEAFVRGLPRAYHTIGLMKPKEVSLDTPWNLDVVVLHAMTLSLSPEVAADSLPDVTSGGEPTPPTMIHEGKRTKYCTFCRIRGHDYEECRSKNNKMVTRAQDVAAQRPAIKIASVNAIVDDDNLVSNLGGMSVNAIQPAYNGSNPNEPRRCYFCGKVGHNAASCFEMKRCREEYLLRKDDDEKKRSEGEGSYPTR
jgi:hypothetical protein